MWLNIKNWKELFMLPKSKNKIIKYILKSVWKEFIILWILIENYFEKLKIRRGIAHLDFFKKKFQNFLNKNYFYHIIFCIIEYKYILLHFYWLLIYFLENFNYKKEQYTIIKLIFNIFKLNFFHLYFSF